MTKDQVMEIAIITAGGHWMDEAHLQRFAAVIRAQTLDEAARLAEYKSHPTYAECAKSIRELGMQE